ncbi:MAG TPA: hypothetical protein VGK59_00395 [Ohtaekwangia sp.]
MNSLKNCFGLFVFVLSLFTGGSSHAQVNKVADADSTAEERNQVSKQIIQLRDTISVKIISLNNQLTSAAPVNKPIVEKATRDMKFYQAQLDKGLDEIISTKVWQPDIRKRSTRLLSDMREKFKVTEKELEKIGYQ